jgi:hypothetical protein
MSTAATTPHTAVPQLIEQRLDTLDRALLDLFPRHERLAIVSQVETRIRELAAANLPIAETTGLPPYLQLGLTSSCWGAAPKRKRSRLAITAGALGILAFALLLASPVTYLIVGMMGEVLGEVVAYSLLGAQAIAVSLGGAASVGLGIIALVSLNRHKDQLAGHGWAIAGLCTGSLPMLLGGAAIVVVGLQFGFGQFTSTTLAPVAGNPVSPAAIAPPEGTGPVAWSVLPTTAGGPQSDFGQPPIQPSVHQVPAGTLQLPAAAGGIVPTPSASPPAAFQSEPAPQVEPRPYIEPQPAPRPDHVPEPVSNPASFN